MESPQVDLAANYQVTCLTSFERAVMYISSIRIGIILSLFLQTKVNKCLLIQRTSNGFTILFMNSK